MRKPQIILFLPSLKSGGAQQQCLFMVNGLSDLYKFILIYDEEGPLYQNFYNSDIKLNIIFSDFIFIILSFATSRAFLFSSSSTM